MVEDDKAGSPKPTISDVARLAGVSKGLVSFAFNNRPGVAPQTRERILAAADELGWRPSLNAKSLSTRTSFALGLVIRREPRIIAADPFFPAFMAGVESVLIEEGRVLVLSVVPNRTAEDRTYRTLVAENRVDGVFLTDLRHDDDRIRLLQGLKVPTATIGHPEASGPFPVVNLDDSTGIAQAVRHLVGLGHRQIAHVAGDPLMLHSTRRADSFRRTMAEAGLDGSVVLDTDFSPAGGAAATHALLESEPALTAIVYANDPMAVAGLGVLHARGLGVPEDLSIVGFDGIDMGRYVFPALTTIEADAESWGAAAARTLLTLIAHGQAPDVELPPAQLVTRASTGPPRSVSHPPTSTGHSFQPLHPFPHARTP
ncbi:MAG: LacI family DNA-binding transcriptional regulator [Propionibacteriaceae bacterium]